MKIACKKCGISVEVDQDIPERWIYRSAWRCPKCRSDAPKVSKFYRVNAREKDILTNLRVPGEKVAGMLSRLTKAAGEMEFEPESLRLVNHRFDFDVEDWNKLREIAQKHEMPIIRIIIQAARKIHQEKR